MLCGSFFGGARRAAAGAVLLTVLLTEAACSTSGTSTVESSKSADGNLSTSPGKALTISPGQLLAATKA